MSATNLKDYQKFVEQSDQFKTDSEKDRGIAISFKNIRRELDYIHQTTTIGRDQVDTNMGRIGDILWYLTKLANHLGINLDEALEKNCEKVAKLYIKNDQEVSLSKNQLERLPKKLEIAFLKKGNETVLVTKLQRGELLQIGDTINDNSWEDDYYRYHDVFHLAYLAHLKWSPVIRALLKRKRKSSPKEDRVEDGARAAIIEESISAIVFERAKKSRNYFEGHETIDFELLDLIKGITRGLEVNACHHLQWEKAIMSGYEVFRQLVKHDGGIVVLSQDSLKFRRLTSDKDFSRLQREVHRAATEIRPLRKDDETKKTIATMKRKSQIRKGRKGVRTPSKARIQRQEDKLRRKDSRRSGH